MLHSLVHARSIWPISVFLFPTLSSSSVHVIVATTGNVRREGQLELCGNGTAAHTCTAAHDAAIAVLVCMLYMCVLTTGI